MHSLISIQYLLLVYHGKYAIVIVGSTSLFLKISTTDLLNALTKNGSSAGKSEPTIHDKGNSNSDGMLLLELIDEFIDKKSHTV